MRLLIIIIILLGSMGMQVLSQECVPATGDPITLGAVFPQDFLLLDDNNTAFNAVLAMTTVFNQCNGGSRPIEWQLEVATNYDDAVDAIAQFGDDNIPLVIGSGMDSVSEGLNDSVAGQGIVFWDVTQPPRQNPSDWTFALRPDDTALGTLTADYIRAEIAPTLLDDPLRVALVTEDIPRALVMAEAVREQLEPFIVVDEPINSGNLAVNIRETDANVLLVISIRDDATDLWFAMRQADANVDAWMFLGQDNLMITRRYVDDRDTTGVMVIGSQHFAVESIEQVIPAERYVAFRDAYHDIADQTPDIQALSAAVGTYYLLASVFSDTSEALTGDEIRQALENTSDTAIFNMTDISPLVVRQNQVTGYCLLAPAPLMTCSEPMQPFPTWRQRAINNQ